MHVKRGMASKRALAQFFFIFVFLYTGLGHAQTISQTGWQLLYADSQELVGEPGAAVNAFDGSASTIWHTEWLDRSPACPHEIQIDLGQTYDINGFRYLPRQDGGVNGRIGQYEFYVSSDRTNWEVVAATGTFANTVSEKTVTFPARSGRFIRLRALSEANGRPWTSMAEINVLGAVSSGNQAPNGTITRPSGNTTINAGESIEFAGTGSDPDGDLQLTYLWQFGAGASPATSTSQNPGLVQFNTTGTYTVTLTVSDSLGLSDPTPATLVVTVKSNSSVIPQTDWQLLYVDSQELVGEPGSAFNAFDGKTSTFWHSQWYSANPPPPHEIQIDLRHVYDVSGFRYLPRQDGGENGGIARYEFYVSQDGVNWGTATATGTFTKSAAEKEISFSTKTGRFIRLRALSEINGNPWTSAAEINVLGRLVSGGSNLPPVGSINSPVFDFTVNPGEWVDFASSASDPDGDVSLSYLWNFGSGSGIPDSTRQSPGLVQFNNPGVFTVTLTVTDSQGLASSPPATRTITVRSEPLEGELVPDWRAVEEPPFSLAPPVGISNPVLTAQDVTDAPVDFVADPFLFHENGTWYLFFEVAKEETDACKIGLATSTDGQHWQYQRVVLAENFHLAHPLVLKYNGHYYMIPDTYSINEVRVYEAANFPYDWHYVSTIMSGRSFVDAAIFRYNGAWWAFTSDAFAGDCYLYYSSSLTGGWTEHPLSPVVVGDRSISRQGGRSFVFDTNRIIRVSQKDDIIYGEQERAFEVDVLNKAEYAEHEIPESPILKNSGTGWNALGMHHFDPWWTGNHWLCSTDGNAPGDNAWTIGIYVTTPLGDAPQGSIVTPAQDVTINVGDWVEFGGTGTDEHGNYPLTYLWQFGTGSGIPDSNLQNPGLVQFTLPGTYHVMFTVTNSLGISQQTPASRTITVVNNFSLLSKANWSLKSTDSQELVGEDGAATNAFDGDRNTFWHTEWWTTNPLCPHEIQIDLGAQYEINGFRYLPRQDDCPNGWIGQYEFYTSLDGTNWGAPVAAGSFRGDADEKEVYFLPVSARYIRLRALTEASGNPWTSAAEISVYGR